jgi:hypothetical protein
MARSGTSGLGRPKGVPNKITTDVKAMILAALDKVGGEAYLARVAVENPAPFLALLGRILPSQLEHSGAVAMAGEAIDRPPPETREQWIARRQRELAVSRQTLASVEPAGSAD